MNRRLREIAKTILNTEGYITGNFLSEINDVSLRTIRTDIKEINKLLKNFDIKIYSEHNKGYYFSKIDKLRLIDEKIIQNLMDSEFINEIPATPFDRMIYILLRSTIEDIQDIDYLAENLCVAGSTILKDVEYARKWLLEHLGLNLTCSLTNGITLIANEIEKRLLISFIFSRKENESTIIKYSNYLDYGNSNLLDVNLLKLLNDTCHEHNLKMSGHSSVLFTMELSVARSRFENGNRINEFGKKVELTKVIEDFKLKYENTVFTVLSINEWVYLQECFFAKQFMFPSDINLLNDDNSKHIIELLVDKIPEFKNANKNELDFIKNELSITIGPMLKRVKNHFCIANEVNDRYIDSVKTSFDRASLIVDIIKEHMNISIKTNELKYLAFQLETLLNPFHKRKKIIIVSDHDYSLLRLIINRFDKIFSDYGEIIDTLTYSELSYYLNNNIESVDFYITTSNIASLTNKSFAHINPVMNLHDLSEIRKLLEI